MQISEDEEDSIELRLERPIPLHERNVAKIDQSDSLVSAISPQELSTAPRRSRDHVEDHGEDYGEDYGENYNEDYGQDYGENRTFYHQESTLKLG